MIICGSLFGNLSLFKIRTRTFSTSIPKLKTFFALLEKYPSKLIINDLLWLMNQQQFEIIFAVEAADNLMQDGKGKEQFKKSFIQLCHHEAPDIRVKAVYALRFFDNKSIVQLNEKMKSDRVLIVREEAWKAWSNRKHRHS